MEPVPITRVALPRDRPCPLGVAGTGAGVGLFAPIAADSSLHLPDSSQARPDNPGRERFFTATENRSRPRFPIPSPRDLGDCPSPCGYDPIPTLRTRLMTPTDRITIHPQQCGGRPCVRGMRIRVSDVLDLLAAGLSPAEVVAELPDLEIEDVTACLKFASLQASEPGAAA